MHKNITASLDRADELLADLRTAYEACLKSKEVSPRALNLTHEVCAMLRGVLDRTAHRYWELHVSPALSEKDRAAKKIYFPIVDSIEAFDSTLGLWRWKSVRDKHQPVYDYMLALQPFVNKDTGWLRPVNTLAIAIKHTDLVPQTKTEEKRVVVSRAGAGAVSYDPRSVRFGHGVRLVGAPVNPATQRIVPTDGVTEKIEIWIGFAIAGSGSDAYRTCKTACAEIRRIAADMWKRFALS